MDHGVIDYPAQIYEIGMPLDHRPPKILTKRGQKKVRCCTSGNNSQITVISCVSAAGQAIPPFVIFDAKSLNTEWADTKMGWPEEGTVPYIWKQQPDHCNQLCKCSRPSNTTICYF